MTTLKNILYYIDIGVTNNNYKEHYIMYIDIIHNYFLNYNDIDFGIRDKILKQCNLIISKLIDYENKELRDDWIGIRKLIVPSLIEEDKELNDDDKYFISSSSI